MLYNANEQEKDILKLWSDDKTFEKSVSERPEDKPYVFYDGPPFATGLPHYGHIVASLIKDVVPRYFTMQGYRVERRWGWDCHGLPIENIVEKELGTKSKKDIETLGVATFNELCRSKVLGYVEDWKKTVNRLGRWVDMENAYRTMDRDYMESVWWVFKQLWDKNLIYEDYRSMHICPRCETTLSQQEVSEGYKEVKDISVFAKFKVTSTSSEINTKLQLPNELDRSYLSSKELNILAWTTTPWTLPGNVLLAVNPAMTYCLIEVTGESAVLVVAKERLQSALEGKEFSVLAEVSGQELCGLTYEPLFPYYKNTANAFRIVAADFVTTEDGTGVVHIAPAFGEDDFKVGKREQIPLVQHVAPDGRFKPEVTDWAGQEVKPRSDDDKVRLATDIAVVKYLQEHNLFFAKKNLVHTYPHCWRCDTPLLNYATSSWFVKVTTVKDKALELATEINWSPEHIKAGRFGKWLEGARDWSISRQRFWASVMPIWKCSCKEQSHCDNTVVFGAVADLEKVSGQTIEDLHKHIVDTITFPCGRCGGMMKRIPDVLDTWFDSGSMPYAQVHYPFDNKAKFEASFPAEFIGEGQDQTRAWFYYLHVLSTALFEKVAFKNVVVNGIVLAEDGKKMSKKLQNYPDPTTLIEKYGADAMRYYLVSSPVMHAESLNFSENGVKEMYGKVINTLWNVYEFYELFAKDTPHHASHASAHPLDKWILVKLNKLVLDVTTCLNAYQLAEAARPIEEFITELSQWYVRRSRDRVKGSDVHDRERALGTLAYVLETLSKIMAPFTPFIAERVYQSVKKILDPHAAQFSSVHLEKWPVHHMEHHDQGVLENMLVLRQIVELGLALRAENKLKVRQPLAAVLFCGSKEYAANANEIHQNHELLAIIAEELNVKSATFAEAPEGDGWAAKEDGLLTVWLNTTIDQSLKDEGMVRELIRAVNQLRKDQGLTVNDRVRLLCQAPAVAVRDLVQRFESEIKNATASGEIGWVEEPLANSVKIGEDKMTISVQKL